MQLLGLALCLLGAAALRRLAGGRGPVRLGPWPGLTPRGAGLVLAAALLLGGTQLLLGAADFEVAARRPLSWLPLAGVGAVASLTLVARLTRMPGAAAAACGAYLLPRTLLSLAVAEAAPPPLLWPPTLLLELALWLRRADVEALLDLLPARGAAVRRARAWRPRNRAPRSLSRRRAALGGLLFGLLLGALEPSFERVLGGDPAAWTGGPALVGALLAGLAGGAAAWLVAAARRSTPGGWPLPR